MLFFVLFCFFDSLTARPNRLTARRICYLDVLCNNEVGRVNSTANVMPMSLAKTDKVTQIRVLTHAKLDCMMLRMYQRPQWNVTFSQPVMACFRGDQLTLLLLKNVRHWCDPFQDALG